MAFSARTRRYLIALLVLGWSITLIYFIRLTNLPKCPLKTKPLYRDNRLLMGTIWEVTSPNRYASAIVFSEASRIEQLLSKYIQTSEISQLNRLGKLKVSTETFYIIKESQEFCRLSHGAFDVTVGPLVNLWGFRDQNFQVPSSNKISAALALVGSDKIILHEKDNVVEFKIPNMQIDLGAIAKGFALDCAVKKLKENKINSCLLNAGGQIYALGDKFGIPWKIAIQGAGKFEIAKTFELKNKSASTSGNYEQFFLKNGVRYCHIIDPRTGYPATSGITSVTVVTDQGLTSDALSTSIFVLGKNDGQELLKKFQTTLVKIY
jgi:FAD:protein FMN transferase